MCQTKNKEIMPSILLEFYCHPTMNHTHNHVMLDLNDIENYSQELMAQNRKKNGNSLIPPDRII